uniref:Uncharacterized protein n=1 Tax=Anguilla anguilla TaxID=7936 RepID=A0A0E9U6M6_ANGAN
MCLFDIHGMLPCCLWDAS